MNLKRPYWLLMFISLGCLVLGYAGWIFLAGHYTKSQPDSQFWIFVAADFLAPFGIIGFFSSLLWMFASGCMNLKRPYWLLMVVSLGCLMLGYSDWMLFAPHDTKSEPDVRFWIFTAAYFLAPFGVIGFFSSLLWMLVSGFRKH